MKTERTNRLVLVAVPWLILAGMVIMAYLPIFRGEKYLLPVKPRDPRDFFRGNYVDLQYEFSNLNSQTIKVDLNPGATYRFGDRLYLDLKKIDGILKPVALVSSPEKAQHVRLKVQPRFSFSGKDIYFDIASGLESFFAPKAAAEDWEKGLRAGRVLAEVAIDSRGNARLVKLQLQPEKPAQKSVEE